MLPNTFTWLPLPHLPKVPEKFIQRARELAVPLADQKDNIMIDRGVYTLDYKNRTIIKDGVEMKSRCQESFLMGDDWEQWVKENIVDRFDETTGKLNVAIDNSTIHGAHVDNPGKIRLYYLIDRGGDEAVTIFYHKPGDPFVYDMDNHNSPTPIHYLNMDELTEIERAVFPLNQWILVNGYTLHGIINVTGPRLNLNISIRPEDFTFDIRTSKEKTND